MALKDENTGAIVPGTRLNLIPTTKNRKKLGKSSVLPPSPAYNATSPKVSDGDQRILPAIGGKSGVIPPLVALESEMKTVLETQVLPHVHAAVYPYRETLTHAECTEIGQTVRILESTTVFLLRHTNIPLGCLKTGHRPGFYGTLFK